LKTRLIQSEDLVGLLRHVDIGQLMDRMIDELELACRDFSEGEVDVRVRDGFHYTSPHVGLVEWMPVMRRGGNVTIKTVGYHPENPGRAQVPTVLSTIGVWDTATGHLLGLADGVFLTALRTGAASAVASRVLANPESRVLGLVGAGAQAVTQFHALSRCFNLERVLVFDTDAQAMGSFASRVSGLAKTGIDIRPAPVDLLLQSADILCTATSVGIGEGPVFPHTETRPWLHINAVGADLPGKTELPLSLLQQSLVCPDFAAQAAVEGECQQLENDQVGPDLLQLLKAPGHWAQWQNKRTVFDSTGFALEDEAAMKLLMALCHEFGLGIELELEATSGDPLNPYDIQPALAAAQVVGKRRKA
jgi:ornithine cyclodeaminase/alanine dehydrogenase-like protein (mu-crystallin family)